MESLSKTSKEDTALKVLKQSPIQEGLICAISTVELCSTLQPFLNLETGKLELKNVTRKCKYYYLYFQDNVFGFMHVKIQSWFPFMMQVYINGREMMKSIFYEMVLHPCNGVQWGNQLQTCTATPKLPKHLITDILPP